MAFLLVSAIPLLNFWPFSPVMISFYYHWLPNSSYGRQAGKIFLCAVFPSNTYKGEERRFLAPFWGNLIPSFLLIDRKEMLFPFSAQRKEQHLELSGASRNPPAGEKTKRAQISNQESGWRPARVHLRACILILSASETEKVYFNMLSQSQPSGKAIFCCGKLSVIKSTHLFRTPLLC